MCGWPARMSSSRRLASSWASGRPIWAGTTTEDEHDQAAGGMQQPQFPRRLPGPLAHQCRDPLALRRVRPVAIVVGVWQGRVEIGASRSSGKSRPDPWGTRIHAGCGVETRAEMGAPR
jgi:hypothetical protein